MAEADTRGSGGSSRVRRSLGASTIDAKVSFARGGQAVPRQQPNTRLSARQKARRDDEIVKARMDGTSWRSIASEHSLSQRQCLTIMREYRQSIPTVRGRDPLELLDEMLERYEGAQDQLAEIAASSTHDTTRVGAIRTSLDGLTAQTKVRRAWRWRIDDNGFRDRRIHGILPANRQVRALCAPVCAPVLQQRRMHEEYDRSLCRGLRTPCVRGPDSSSSRERGAR
jgi:hypothetical protein